MFAMFTNVYLCVFYVFICVYIVHASIYACLLYKGAFESLGGFISNKHKSVDKIWYIVSRSV